MLTYYLRAAVLLAEDLLLVAANFFTSFLESNTNSVEKTRRKPMRKKSLLHFKCPEEYTKKSR